MPPTEEEIVDATQRANPHEFVVELPNGYDSLIGERGVRLSRGQAGDCCQLRFQLEGGLDFDRPSARQ